MKKLLIISVFFILIGCKSTTYIPIETVVRYHDTTIVHQDTIHITVEKEAYTYNSSLLDTLRMETKYAYSTAYIDTTHNLLNGYITNKPIDIPIQVQWKERIIRNDSIVYQQIPVEIPNQRTERKLSIYKTITQALALIIIILSIPIIIITIKKFK